MPTNTSNFIVTFGIECNFFLFKYKLNVQVPVTPNIVTFAWLTKHQKHQKK